VSTTREKILEAALRLFRERGYAGTTIAQIERAAGLAPRTGGFYRHFSSKADLAVEIGRTSIIETRHDLGFDGVLPLGDTRAELVLIARGYLRAAMRQAPLAKFIAEVQELPQIQALQNEVSTDLLGALTDWVATKPRAREQTQTQRMALVLSVFGGWIFYVSKRGAPPESAQDLTDEVMLHEWAQLWADVLDVEESRLEE
jgi:AcrR family transcriptional regulator